MKQIVFAIVILFTLSTSAYSLQIKKEWLGSPGATCPKLGINAAYRAFASVTGDLSSTSFAVIAVSLYISSAATQTGEVDLVATVQVIDGEKAKESVGLVGAEPNSMSRSPGPNETKELFLPLGKRLLVAAGRHLRLIVSPTLSGAAGTCALGTSSQNIRVPMPKNVPSSE